MRRGRSVRGAATREGMAEEAGGEDDGMRSERIHLCALEALAQRRQVISRPSVRSDCSSGTSDPACLSSDELILID